MGKSVYDFLEQNYVEQGKDRYRKILESGQVGISEYKIKKLNGNVIHAEAKSIVTIFEGIPAIQTVARDITEKKKLEERLKYLALHDELTELPNRRLFKNRLKESILQAELDQKYIALLYLDCDNFKHINDTFGHEMGDKVLKEFSKRISSCIRDSDTLARFGGDEFMVLIPNIDSKQVAFQIVNNILRAVKEPLTLEGEELILSSSIGVAFYPFDGKNHDVLIKKADSAMYLAKNGGKNQFKVIS